MAVCVCVCVCVCVKRHARHLYECTCSDLKRGHVSCKYCWKLQYNAGSFFSTDIQRLSRRDIILCFIREIHTCFYFLDEFGCLELLGALMSHRSATCLCGCVAWRLWCPFSSLWMWSCGTASTQRSERLVTQGCLLHSQDLPFSLCVWMWSRELVDVSAALHHCTSPQCVLKQHEVCFCCTTSLQVWWITTGSVCVCVCACGWDPIAVLTRLHGLVMWLWRDNGNYLLLDSVHSLLCAWLGYWQPLHNTHSHPHTQNETFNI